MHFVRSLRERIRRGRIKCSVRIWTRPHVKPGGRYRMDDGQIVVDSIVRIRRREITRDLARESGFDGIDDLLRIAKHGAGNKVYVIRFHYLPPGGWDTGRRIARQRRRHFLVSGNGALRNDADAFSISAPDAINCFLRPARLRLRQQHGFEAGQIAARIVRVLALRSSKVGPRVFPPAQSTEQVSM